MANPLYRRAALSAGNKHPRRRFVTLDDFKLTNKLLNFPNLAAAKDTVFNPQDSLYWQHSVKYYEGANTDQFAVDPTVNALEEHYFNEV